MAPLEQRLPAVVPPPWLLPHQADAVLRAWAILDRFGGVLVADGAGLGKTFVGLALGVLERARGGEALVVAPAHLRHEWDRAAAEAGVPLAFVSHTALALRRRRVAPAVSLLIVDEAHGFRNARTRRYDTLARLATGRRVALLTATPVNNSAADLVALVHLFAGADDFRLLGAGDLFAALREHGGAEAALALGALTVSRSRRLVESRFPSLRGAFPRRELLAPVRYDLDAAYGGALASILDALADLDGDLLAAEPGAALLALGLLRRLESGRTAFIRSLRRHSAFLREWATARETGRVLTRRGFHGAFGRFDERAPQLVLWPLLLDGPSASALRGDHAWHAAIERALALAEAADTETEPKLRALEDLLTGPLRGRKTIVFTEFRDTALALARHLRRRVRLLCVAGDGAWAGTGRLPRAEALDAFAPRARGATPATLLEADVLVATDVASEGMNLQDASAVVNYDLPWNPVRVMQRVGRIDRLHSPHERVSVAHLIPGHGLQDLAGVLRTLRAKLSVLPVAAAPEPDPLNALWWLDGGVPSPEALERESWHRVEPFEARERWRAACPASVPTAGPCVAAGLTSDDGPSAAGLLLALEWPGGARIPLPYVLEPGGRCRCDATALGALAERALASEPLPAAPADFATTLAAVLPDARARLVALSAARHSSSPRGTGRVAALRLLARAGRAAARSRDAAALETLSGMSRTLSRELPAGLDRDVLDACRHADAPALRSLEPVLAKAIRRPDLDPPNGSPRLVLLAALAVASRCPADPLSGALAPGERRAG